MKLEDLIGMSPYHWEFKEAANGNVCRVDMRRKNWNGHIAKHDGKWLYNGLSRGSLFLPAILCRIWGLPKPPPLPPPDPTPNAVNVYHMNRGTMICQLHGSQQNGRKDCGTYLLEHGSTRSTVLLCWTDTTS